MIAKSKSHRGFDLRERAPGHTLKVQDAKKAPRRSLRCQKMSKSQHDEKQSSGEPDNAATQRRLQRAKALFSELPNDPAARVEAIREIYRDVRRQVSDVLSSTIAELLKAHDENPQTVDASSLVHEINQSLADSRLAIQNPVSGNQATLILSRPSRTSGYSYLRLCDSSPSSTGKRTFLSLAQLREFPQKIALVDENSISRGRSR